MEIQVLAVLLSLVIAQGVTSEIRWDHSTDLDENFRLLWRVKEPDIIMEVQVKTLGYIGIGFTRSELIYGADMVVGWVDNTHTYFQVGFDFDLKLRNSEENSPRLLCQLWSSSAPFLTLILIGFHREMFPKLTSERLTETLSTNSLINAKHLFSEMFFYAN